MELPVSLTLAALVWFGIHAGIAGSPLRKVLVTQLGEARFRGAFSLLSLCSLTWLIWAYQAAPVQPLWPVPGALAWLPLVLVPFAFMLLVGAFAVPNATSVGGEKALEQARPVRGVLRLTRHPFLWAVFLWALAHLAATSSLSALLFFGSHALTALVGTFDIDRKRARQLGDRWWSYVDRTSNVPFAAILAGRNRLALDELGVPALGAIVLTALTLHFHLMAFGADALRALR
jgi:uncharacterized membrane protein